MDGKEVRERIAAVIDTGEAIHIPITDILAELADRQHHDSKHLEKTGGLVGELLARIEKMEAEQITLRGEADNLAKAVGCLSGELREKIASLETIVI